MSKKAIITGISGQDGAYLAKYLLELGYKVFGAVRRSSRSAEILPRLKYLGIEKEVELIDFELSELTNITRVIKSTQPDEIYNLGGQSFVGASWEQPLTTTDINAVAVLRILETIREYSAETRFYQASTSEMFGAISPPQSETTPLIDISPSSLYSVVAVEPSLETRCGSEVVSYLNVFPKVGSISHVFSKEFWDPSATNSSSTYSFI